jgi:CheY-like chemotaxis protein
VNYDRTTFFSDIQMSDKKLPRILCSDDDPAIREMLSRILTRAGYECECVAESMEALGKVLEEPGKFGIVITDISMPRLSGLELIRRLRERNFQGGIIIFSGSIGLAGQEHCKRFGADGIVNKPAHAGEILDAVARVRGLGAHISKGFSACESGPPLSRR